MQLQIEYTIGRKQILQSVKMTCVIYYYCVPTMSTFVLVVKYINKIMMQPWCPLRACYSWYLYDIIREASNTNDYRQHFSLEKYVDDTFLFIKKGCVEHVLACLHSFHKNIQFTYELENQNKLPFLDVWLIRRGTKIETTGYRNSTNNDNYLNWSFLTLVTQKRGTLKMLFNRFHIVCSADYHLRKELDH